jgi:hypothetical protein
MPANVTRQLAGLTSFQQLLNLHGVTGFAANSAADNLAALWATLGFLCEFRFRARTLNHELAPDLGC